jgi:hypothetical protein
MSPSRLLRLAVAALAAAWLVAPTGPRTQPPPAADPSCRRSWTGSKRRFQTRDVSGWLALREFETPDERSSRRRRCAFWFATDEVVFTLLRRPTARPATRASSVEAQVFIATEPRARVVFWTLRIERRASGWALVSRPGGQPDGRPRAPLARAAGRSARAA